MAESIYNPKYVKRLFNRMSPSYNPMSFITSFGFSNCWRRRLLKTFQPTEDKIEIIDLLSGMGESWNSIRCKFPNARITALDFSTEMLNKAKNRSKKHFRNDIILLQQNVLQNELLSNNYDYVICAFGLKTFNNKQLEILAKETKRILKIGGKFSFIEVSKPNTKKINFLYRFYLAKVIPVIGKLLSGNSNQYKMLWKYMDKFENAKKATEIFNKRGLHANYVSFSYGCCTGFIGQKLHE